MAFQVPTFNLTANIYHWPNGPPGIPDVITPCQLRASGRQSSGLDTTTAGSPFLWELLVPALTDVRDRYNIAGIADKAEVPAGSGRVYFTAAVDDVAKGFTNEYRMAVLQKTGVWPTPIP